MKIISASSTSSRYLIVPITAAGTSITDRLPALKFMSVGSSSPISSVENILALIPRFFASSPSLRVVVLFPHSWDVPPTNITGFSDL